MCKLVNWLIMQQLWQMPPLFNLLINKFANLLIEKKCIFAEKLKLWLIIKD